jgi:hypothetical protein
MKSLRDRVQLAWDLRFVIVMLLGFILFCILLVEAFLKRSSYMLWSFAIIIVGVLAEAWRVRRRNEKRGWRVQCASPVGWAYEEMRDGVWEGITFPELGDYRESPHVIDLGAAPKWTAYPDWMRERREEILTRVRSELKRPHYILRENA